jgi:serine/threonine protein kinase
MQKKNPEDYFNCFTIDRRRSDPTTELFFINFQKKHPKSGYPNSSYLKIVKTTSKEPEMQKKIIEAIPDYSLKIHHISEHETTRELFMETTEHGSLSSELDNFSKFPEHYILKAVYQLSYALKLLHIRNIYLGNIKADHVFLSNFLKFVNFEKSGIVADLDWEKELSAEREEGRDGEGRKYLEELNHFKQVLPGIQDIRMFDVWALGVVFLQFFIGKCDKSLENNPGEVRLLFEKNQEKITIKPVRNVLKKMLEIPPGIDMVKVVSKITFNPNFLTIRRFGPMCFYCFQENIMNDERGDNEIKNFVCPHFFHNGCMRNYLKELIRGIRQLEELHCKFCMQPFPYELEKIVPKFDIESRFKSEKLFYRNEKFICPNGHICPADKMLNNKLEPYKVSCQVEHRSYCSFCSDVHNWFFGRSKCKVLDQMKENLIKRLSLDNFLI